MPLIEGTSKKTFAKNVKKEVAAKIPTRQAIAIAFAEKRKAQKRASNNRRYS